MRFNPAAVAALAAALMVSTAVRADVVIGNLGPTGASNPSGGGVFYTSPEAVAFGFTTGSDPLELQLSSAVFGVFNPAGGSVTATLYEGATPDGPGTPLSTQTLPTAGGAGSKVEFVTGGWVNLNPNQAYTIVLSPSSPGGVTWAFPATTPTEQNSSGWGSPTALTSADGLTNWGPAAAFGAVSLTAVPEPSTYALAGVGLLAAGLLRRYRKSRRVAG